MIGLLTWTTWGTWLNGPGRGWIDRQDSLRGADPADLPQPDEESSRRRRKSLKWPAAFLNEQQKRLIIEDLHRVAGIRSFWLLAVAVEEKCVRAVVECADDRDIERLVQLVKGALSRRLTVGSGDLTASSTTGRPLVHHKWWPRQYSFLRVEGIPLLRKLIEVLRSRAQCGAAVWTADIGTG